MTHPTIKRFLQCILIFFMLTSAHAATDCTRILVSVVPLTDDALFLHIPLLINGQRQDMIIDTGSEGSLITPVAAGALNLPVDPQRRTVIHGPDGRSDLVSNRVAYRLQIGALKLGGWSFPLGILPNLPRNLENLSGLIGADLLQNFAVEFDAPHHILRLWRYDPAVKPQSCATAPPTPPQAGEKSWMPIVAHRRGLRLNVGFNLDGYDGNALVDSGARSITLSRRFANSMGVTNDMLGKDRGGVTSGVDLNARYYYWHHFNKLTLASTEAFSSSPETTLKAPVITVSDVYDDADMLLGADWLARHDVWIDFVTARVWVR